MSIDNYTCLYKLTAMCLNRFMVVENTNTEPWETLWFNATIATMRSDISAYGLLENGAIAVSNGKVVWVGPYSEVTQAQLDSCQNQFDCEGKLITPGLIDCHTHLVYGGNRANEFEMRLKGASYSEIARAGGGIASTVTATRESSEEELFLLAEQRLQSLPDGGHRRALEGHDRRKSDQ